MEKQHITNPDVEGLDGHNAGMIQGKTDDPDRLVRSFWWLLVKASEPAYSLRHAARISNCSPSTAFDTTGIDVLGYNWITKSNYQAIHSCTSVAI